MLRIVSLCSLIVILAGCSSQNGGQLTYNDYMDGLRQANFRGQVQFTMTGKPLAFNIVNGFEIGNDVNFAFSGTVDFEHAPRSPEEIMNALANGDTSVDGASLQPDASVSP